MTVQVRIVQLSGSADDLLRNQADEANMDPDLYSSLVLEIAVRERHALAQAFAAAIAKVDKKNG